MEYGISAIIPTRNRSPYQHEERRNPLFLSVNSLYEQTVPPDETIIIDDCSHDFTQDVVECLSRDFPVKYIKLERRVRPSLARRFGIESSYNPLLLFLDDDSFPYKTEAIDVLTESRERYDLDVIVPPITFRGTGFKGEAPHDRIGKLEKNRMHSNFDKRPYPYAEMVEISNLPGIFLAKKDCMKPEYFVSFPWPSDFGTESLLARSLVRDGKRLGYLANEDAGFVHLKYGWHIDDFEPAEEVILTLPDDISFIDLQKESNMGVYNELTRDGTDTRGYYMNKFAFLYYLHLIEGGRTQHLSESLIEQAINNDFSSYGKVDENDLPGILDQAVDMVERSIGNHRSP